MINLEIPCDKGVFSFGRKAVLYHTRIASGFKKHLL